jgi:hypothetical protein
VRKRQADVGAPEGFEDAVAWLVPATAETPADAKPPHWSVTFAIDDADAIADRAVELGGTVLVPPVDAPWVRMTVVADPRERCSPPASSPPRSKYRSEHRSRRGDVTYFLLLYDVDNHDTPGRRRKNDP